MINRTKAAVIILNFRTSVSVFVLCNNHKIQGVPNVLIVIQFSGIRRCRFQKSLLTCYVTYYQKVTGLKPITNEQMGSGHPKHMYSFTRTFNGQTVEQKYVLYIRYHRERNEQKLMYFAKIS